MIGLDALPLLKHRRLNMELRQMILSMRRWKWLK